MLTLFFREVEKVRGSNLSDPIVQGDSLAECVSDPRDHPQFLVGGKIPS
jgi:hypothetical protein